MAQRGKESSKLKMNIFFIMILFEKVLIKDCDKGLYYVPMVCQANDFYEKDY